MTKETVKKILDAYENLDIELMKEYSEKHDLFLELLSELQERERNIVMDYFGVCIEVHLKLLESITDMG